MTKPIDLLSAVKALVRKEVNATLRARLLGHERRPPKAVAPPARVEEKRSQRTGRRGGMG